MDSDLADIFDSAQVDGDAGIADSFRGALCAALGQPTSVSDIALISRPVWESTLETVLVGDPQTKLTPVMSSRANLAKEKAVIKLPPSPPLPFRRRALEG